MPQFKIFKNSLKQNFEKQIKNVDQLFLTDIDADKLYELYLDSFPEGYNNIFRERREYDCNYCKRFIKNIGNVVFVDKSDFNIKSIWDFECDYPFNVVAKAMSDYVKSRPINGFFTPYSTMLGYHKGNREFTHLDVQLPNEYYKVYGSEEMNYCNKLKNKQVESFKKSLNLISLDSINKVIDLINDGLIEKANPFVGILTSFKDLMQQYMSFGLTNEISKSIVLFSKANDPAAHIHKTEIGKLLIDISNGIEIDKAIEYFNRDIILIEKA